MIYCQFRVLAQILGRICQGENWGYLYLTGDSSLDHRGKAIKLFQQDPNIKILIAGLKCGGLGLNFPWANHCISLDLWWNHAVEQQAFGRIFRIGQKKETFMTRIVVRKYVLPCPLFPSATRLTLKQHRGPTPPQHAVVQAQDVRARHAGRRY